MLQSVVQDGTAKRAKVLKRDDLAGKTGTTDEYRDAWFNGFAGDVVATAWVGFDQVASLGRGETGSRAALPMWIDYMRVALDGTPDQPLVPPEGIVTAYVDSDTGAPTSWLSLNAIQEYFVQGTEGAPTVGATEAPTGDSANPAEPAAPEVPPDAEKIRQELF